MDGTGDVGTGLAIIFAFLMIFLAVLFLVAVANYVMTAIAVYRIANRRGIDHAFLAWIPVAQLYLYAVLIGTNVKVGNVTVPQYPWIYTGIICLGGFVSGMIQNVSRLAALRTSDQLSNYGTMMASNFGSTAGVLIGGALYLIIMVVRIYTMYRVFKLFKGNTVLYTVLGAIIPFAEPIILLILGNKPFAEDPETVPAA